MNAAMPPSFDDSGWQVPTFDTALYHERRHAHALVIPVINEGERIRGQIVRIKAANLPVDVIIADGGSTDGSLDPAFIGDAGVRAVLTKTGPGKLSAQLRVAYAWCLRQGYAGIVTIDGNGKDGVEAVATMVARLEAGCDYVQGSRYLPGGEAENTPLERTIANRVIHAPLLSLAGRHWFTDTTNGFRAYSARYLTHPEVQPFREEFQVYSLLFYLTVRAGQLGLQVDHVPVERRYPDSGKVPTKIGGFASKLALLGETVFAATGGHTPDAAVPAKPSFGLVLLALFAVLLPLLASVVASPAFSPDSWSLFELARSLWDDPYRFSTFRSYASEVPYSTAFPPLTPALIALVDGLLGTGPRTGLYLAFGFFTGFALLSERIGQRVTGSGWFGLGAALLLLLGPGMVMTELEAGRTIPLQLFLYALILLGLLRGIGMTVADAAGVGLVAGLAVLNRFDAALLPLLLAGMVLWLTRRPACALAALAAAVLAVSPWIAFSLARFGTLFATDNAGIALSIDPRAFVTDWWPAPQPTFADDPAAWVGRMTGNVGGLIHSGASLMVSAMGLVIAGVAALLVGLLSLASRRSGTSSWAALRLTGSLAVMIGFTLMLAAMLLPQILTGYTEYRYFSAIYWTLFLTGLSALVASGSTLHQRAVLGQIAFAGIFAAVLPFAGITLLQAAAAGEVSAAAWPRFDAPTDVARLQRCLASDPSARILVLDDDRFAAQAGALSGLATMMEPRNRAEGRLNAEGSRAFLAAWHVDYVLAMTPARTDNAQAMPGVERVPDCPLALYRLTWKE